MEIKVSIHLVDADLPFPRLLFLFLFIYIRLHNVWLAYEP